MNLDTHIEGLIRELEIDHEVIRSVHITPSEVTVEVFLLNDGAKFIRDDGHVASEVLTFKHRAFRGAPA